MAQPQPAPPPPVTDNNPAAAAVALAPTLDPITAARRQAIPTALASNKTAQKYVPDPLLVSQVTNETSGRVLTLRLCGRGYARCHSLSEWASTWKARSPTA